MAMDKDRLATAIVTALQASNAEITGAAQAALLAQWKLIANEFINEIKNHATVAVTSVSGVTVGGGTSGPGTGSVS